MDAAMDRLAEFLAMGGYADFVWPAYGVAALVLVAMLAVARARLKRSEAELRRLALRLPGRAGVAAGAPEPP
jgi:heme exporter protein D